MIPGSESKGTGLPHKRRVRYAGKNPRKFEEKYKEHDPVRYASTVAKVVASGKTPAGSHRPIMVEEVLAILEPQHGEIAVDCTLGYGGHARMLLEKILPGGKLIGLDADPIELPRTEERLRATGFGPDVFKAERTNFAGLQKALGKHEILEVDMILADLGVSSMQLDDPKRGFSFKLDGPLDMRMNPNRGEPASALLTRMEPESLSTLLTDNADEPHAITLGEMLAGREIQNTRALALAVKDALPHLRSEDLDSCIRRVFQALRIAVNDEFAALDGFLRQLPECLKPGGRVAILTFHSGEDRRVKRAFDASLRSGLFEAISKEVLRPSAEERASNPRSSPAKLRWARKTANSHS